MDTDFEIYAGNQDELRKWLSSRGLATVIGAWDNGDDDAGWMVALQTDYSWKHWAEVVNDWETGKWYCRHVYGEPVYLVRGPSQEELFDILQALDQRLPIPTKLLADPDDPCADPPPLPPRRVRDKPLTDEEREGIVEAYRKQQSAEVVGREFKVSHQTVINLARKAGVSIRSNKERKVSDDDRLAISQAYSAGESTVSLAKRFSIAQSTATEIVKEAGIRIRTRGKRLTPAEREAVANSYAEGKRSPELAREYGVSKQTILSIVRGHGGEIQKER